MPKVALPFKRRKTCDRLCRAAFLLFVLAAPVLLAPRPAASDLFAQHEVTAQFATPDGKPMANAEVEVFAPGDPKMPVVTGRTDADGKFVFDADRDGFWSAQARSADQVARVMIRVGGASEPQSRVSPFVVIGVLAVLLGIAIWYRVARLRTRRPHS